MSSKSRRRKMERQALGHVDLWRPGQLAVTGKTTKVPWVDGTPRPPEVADSTEEILAWRGWGLVHDPYYGTRLQSLSAQTIWDGPTLVADGDPAEEHRGVHAQAEQEWRRERSFVFVGHLFRDISFVEGVVALSGKVVVGATGYRAERATIQRLILRASPPRWPEEGRGLLPDPVMRSKVGEDPRRWISWSSSILGVVPSIQYTWPESVSFLTAVRELGERYQCDVETPVEVVL